MGLKLSVQYSCARKHSRHIENYTTGHVSNRLFSCYAHSSLVIKNNHYSHKFFALFISRLYIYVPRMNHNFGPSIVVPATASERFNAIIIKDLDKWGDAGIDINFFPPANFQGFKKADSFVVSPFTHQGRLSFFFLE